MMYNRNDSFVSQFAERTLQILKMTEKNTAYEATLLIDCLLGLIVLPWQKYQKKIKNKWIDEKLLEELKMCIEEQDEDLSLDQIITRIRHGVCHGNIQFNPEILDPFQKEDKIIGVRIYSNGRNSSDSAFAINLKIEQLRGFAEAFAEDIIKRERRGK